MKTIKIGKYPMNSFLICISIAIAISITYSEAVHTGGGVALELIVEKEEQWFPTTLSSSYLWYLRVIN
jgi:hypothetical protein